LAQITANLGVEWFNLQEEIFLRQALQQARLRAREAFPCRRSAQQQQI